MSEEEIKQIPEDNQNKDHIVWYSILLLGILLVLCGLFALQYNTTCKMMLTYHLFDLLKEMLAFLHNFVKDFSWTFLILLLFVLPHCMENVIILAEKAALVLVSYSKGVKIENQTPNEKKDFEKEKNQTISEPTATSHKSNKILKAELDNHRTQLRKFATDFVKKNETNNVDDFKPNSKLVFNDDPVLQSGSLLFDFSYRYKGADRARRYINTLILPELSPLSSNDGLYKYIRIMDDINRSKRNQRYAVEIIIINPEPDKRKSIYDDLEERYAYALDKGVLAIKEYVMENGVPALAQQNGWILD